MRSIHSIIFFLKLARVQQWSFTFRAYSSTLTTVPERWWLTGGLSPLYKRNVLHTPKRTPLCTARVDADMSLRKSLRRTFLPLLGRLGLVTDAERKTLEAIRRSVNTNGTALYNLLHCMPILEHMLGSVGQTFDNKNVLEIGSTNPPGLPLALLLGGCAKFYGNNILDIGNRLPMEYAEVVNIMMSRLRGVDPMRFQHILDCETQGGQRVAVLRKEVFEPLPRCPAEQLTLPDACIDIAFSVSVLEHLENTREVLVNLHRMLRPGGWSLHLIDLRDHSDFGKPLEFLKYGQAEYERLGGSFQNRLRASDFLALFEDSGYRVEQVGYMTQPPGVIDADTTDLFHMGSKPISQMYQVRSIEALEHCIGDELFASFHADFRAKTRQELSVMGMCVICQRPA
jgi:SAM-dependent methyltransferase